MKLHFYFARKFGAAVFAVFALFTVLLTMLDVVDQMRRFSDAGITMAGALRLSLLSVPETLYSIFPLIVILATLMLFLGLARTSEMVVTRASGRSAISALVSPCLAAFIIGVVGVAILNPIVAATQKQYELSSGAYKQGGAQVISVSREGLWLRQGGPEGQTVIRAEGTNLDGTQFSKVTFIRFAQGIGPNQRIEAESAALYPGEWRLTRAKVWPLQNVNNPERNAVLHDMYTVPSTLTQDQIRDSFGTPSAIPIWDLPGFITNLDRAGFSARLHRVWFHMQLALPLFLVAMVMIGAGFTMRHTRFGRTGVMVLMALMLGLGAFFIRNFAQILGENGQIPIALAAWAPPAAVILLSFGLLLHLEDG